jgi:transcriptional regulator with XRE-family HTH domain
MSTEDSDNFRISLMIRSARSILGLSLKELADTLDVGASTIGKWENNELTLKASTFMKMNKYFESQGIYFDMLLNGELIIKVKPVLVESLMSKKK